MLISVINVGFFAKAASVGAKTVNGLVPCSAASRSITDPTTKSVDGSVPPVMSSHRVAKVAPVFVTCVPLVVPHRIFAIVEIFPTLVPVEASSQARKLGLLGVGTIRSACALAARSVDRTNTGNALLMLAMVKVRLLCVSKGSTV